MKTIKVLFIGNSHTYVNSMPKIFMDIANSDLVKVEACMNAHPGWYLKQHLENPEAKFNILYGGYDYIVLQEHAHPFDSNNSYFDSIRGLNEFIKQTSSKLVISTTWAEEKYPENFANMMEKHRTIAKELGCLLSPVDEKWLNCLKNNPEIKLYGPDGEHASLAGSTLVAKTLWTTIKEDLELGGSI